MLNVRVAAHLISKANEAKTPEEAYPYFKQIFEDEDLNNAHSRMTYSYFWNFWCTTFHHDKAYNIFMEALNSISEDEVDEAKEIVLHYCHNKLYGYESLLEWRDDHVTGKELEDFMNFRKLMEAPLDVNDPENWRVNI